MRDLEVCVSGDRLRLDLRSVGLSFEGDKGQRRHGQLR